MTVSEDPFAKEIASYRTQVYHYLCKVTRDPELSEDLTQQTIIKGIEARDSYQHDSPVSAWLYVIGRNLFFNHYRHEARWQRRIEPELRRRALEQSERSELADLLEEGEQTKSTLLALNYFAWCMAQFPKTTRMALELSIQGLPDRHIAAELGLPGARVRGRLYRARLELRRRGLVEVLTGQAPAVHNA